MKSKPDVDIIGPLSSVSEEQGAPSSSCWRLMSSLPLPLLSGRSSVCSFRVCLIQSVSMETLRQEESAPPPVPLPLSPNLWDFTVLLPCDSIVSQQPLYTNKTDYLHGILRKTLLALVYTLALSIQPKGVCSLFIPHKQSWRNICKPNLHYNLKKI